MAKNKIYIIMKNGVELEQLVTLSAAKKMADAEGAEVYCDGVCIYPENLTAPATPTNPIVTTDDKTIITAQPIVAEKQKQPIVDDPKTEKYRLKKLMNVRAKPSKEATILTTKPAGTVVRVFSVEDDWLYLADGSFILYRGGEFAEKV